jgi:hypothetical protein
MDGNPRLKSRNFLRRGHSSIGTIRLTPRALGPGAIAAKAASLRTSILARDHPSSPILTVNATVNQFAPSPVRLRP